MAPVCLCAGFVTCSVRQNICRCPIEARLSYLRGTPAAKQQEIVHLQSRAIRPLSYGVAPGTAVKIALIDAMSPQTSRYGNSDRAWLIRFGM